MSDKAKIPTAYEFLKQTQVMIPYNSIEGTIKALNDYAKIHLQYQAEEIKEKAELEDRFYKTPSNIERNNLGKEIQYDISLPNSYIGVDKSSIEEAHQNYLKENNLK